MPRPRKKSSADPIFLLGVKINPLTEKKVLKIIEHFITVAQGQFYLVTTNPEFIIQAQKDSHFRHILNQASLSLADGIGIRAAAQYLKQPLLKIPPPLNILADLFYGLIYLPYCILFQQQKLTLIPQQLRGADLTEKLMAQAASKKWRVFLLGAAPGIAAQTAKIWQKKYPGLKIVGTLAGDPQPEKDLIMRQKIKAQAKTIDLLLVAYGHPKQEKWIYRNLKHLPVKVAIGVGGTFDFVSGKQKRAPQSWQKHGLEWLWRLIHQPWRWRRQKDLLIFLLLIFREKWFPPQNRAAF